MKQRMQEILSERADDDNEFMQIEDHDPLQQTLTPSLGKNPLHQSLQEK